MVGILLSYWGGLFSGATLVSGRVIFETGILFVSILLSKRSPQPTGQQYFKSQVGCSFTMSLGCITMKISHTQRVPKVVCFQHLEGENAGQSSLWMAGTWTMEEDVNFLPWAMGNMNISDPDSNVSLSEVHKLWGFNCERKTMVLCQYAAESVEGERGGCLCFFSRMIFNSLFILKNDEDPILFMHVHTYRIYLIYLSVLATDRRPVGTAHLEQGLAAPGQVILHGISRVEVKIVPFLVCFSNVSKCDHSGLPHWSTCRISINQPTLSTNLPWTRQHPSPAFPHGFPHRFGCSGFVASYETAAF